MSGRTAILTAALLALLSANPTAADEAASPRRWLEQAQEYAARIQVPDGRAATLVSIGTGYLDAGLAVEARPLLKEAAAYGARCEGCFAKATRLADLALLQAQAGDPMAAEQTFRLARKACDDLKEDADRLPALAYLGARRRDAGDPMLARPLFGEAFAGAKALKGKERWDILADLALTFVTAEEETLAGATFSLLGSRAVAENARIARIALWIERREYEKAERHLSASGLGLQLRMEGLLDLALAYARDGRTVRARAHVTEAGRLARAMHPGEGRAEALLHVARTASRVGVENQAQTALLEAVGTVSARESTVLAVQGLLDCARTAHGIGKRASLRRMLTEIPRLADGIEDPVEQDEARLRVVEAAGDIGEFAAAERAVPKIREPAVRAQAKVALAESYRGDDNCMRALLIASKLLATMAEWSEEERAVGLGLSRRLAVVQAACGETDAAAETVQAIAEVSPFQAALACTTIARDL